MTQRHWILTLLMMSIGCGDAGGVGCDASYEYPRMTPEAAVTQGASVVRLTQSAMDAVTGGVPDLLGSQCSTPDDPSATCYIDPNDSNLVWFYLGEPCAPLESGIDLFFTSIDAELRTGDCNGQSLPRSKIGLHLDSMAGNLKVDIIEDAQGPGLELTLGCDENNLNACAPDNGDFVRLSPDLVWALTGFGLENSCAIVNDDRPDGGIWVQRLRFIFRINIEIRDDQKPYLVLEPEDTNVDDVDLIFHIRQQGAANDPYCDNDGCQTWCTVTNGLQSALEVLLETEILASFIGESLVDGVFGDLLDEPLEGSGQLNLKELLPIGGARGNPTGFLATANRDNPRIMTSGANKALDFTVDVGFDGAPARFVPPVSPPSFVVPQLDFNDFLVQTDLSDNPFEVFDVMVMLSDAAIERAAFELFQAGNLHFNLGGDDLAELSGGSFSPTVSLFSLFAPQLGEIASPETPVGLAIRPNLPPVVDFGTGDVLSEDETDSSIKVVWPNVELQLYPILDDAEFMALAFSFDLVAGISLLPDPAGLEVRIDKIELSNVFQTYDEMGISFDEQGLQDVIAGLLPSLLGTGEPIIIELNEAALGIPLVPKVLALHPLDTQKKLLGVFLKLCTETTQDSEICQEPTIDNSTATKAALRASPSERLVYLDLGDEIGELRAASIQMSGLSVRHAFRKTRQGWVAALPHVVLPGEHTGDLEIALRDGRIAKRAISFLSNGVTYQPGIATNESTESEPFDTVYSSTPEIAVEYTNPETGGCNAATPSSLVWLLACGLYLWRRRISRFETKPI